MMLSWWPWLIAALLYGVFRLWYDNRRGRLRAEEIDAFLAAAAARDAAAPSDLGIIRAFLEADDGREFFMVNLVKCHGAVAHPQTGAPTTGQEMLQAYSRVFVRNMLRYGGHPALATRKVGGYVDSWAVPPDPGWHIVGYMRYRSRRDMIAMATDPAFDGIHQFKMAGVAETFSFPSQPAVSLLWGPRLWLAVLLALFASLAQIILLVTH